MLAGSEGSIIDVFGKGEYEYDRFEVRLHEQRGDDNGVSIRYGRNLTDILKESDISDIYTAIVPYWTGTDPDTNGDIRVYLPEGKIESDYVSEFPTKRTIAVDFTDKFEQQPSVEELRGKARTYLNNNVRRQIITTIQTSYIDLATTDEYRDIARLEEVNLCDYVTVSFDALNINEKQQVVKIEYDVLMDRNKAVYLGELRKTLADVISPKSLMGSVKQMINNAMKSLKSTNPFPIGAIFLTIENVNPSTYFPNTTWEKIEEGRFLRSGNTAEEKGGDKYHSHEYHVYQDLNMNVTLRYNNEVFSAPVIETLIADFKRTKNSSLTTKRCSFELKEEAITNAITTSGNMAIYYADTSSEESVPPYYTVHMWKRVA